MGIPHTEEARRAYREMIVATPGVGDCISGVILYDGTIRQKVHDGTPFIKVLTDAWIILGIKVDAGAKDMAGDPGEKMTEGLDRLPARLQEYVQMGAGFPKWWAVLAIGDGIPSQDCIVANAQALEHYAVMCQEGALVPIVEPEVLMNGTHTMELCGTATEGVPRFTAEARKANRALVDLLGPIAERKNATPAQIALAWLLAQKPWIVPIPGTTKVHRLQENVAAVAVELGESDLRVIESATLQITVQGARYSEAP